MLAKSKRYPKANCLLVTGWNIMFKRTKKYRFQPVLEYRQIHDKSNLLILIY